MCKVIHDSVPIIDACFLLLMLLSLDSTMIFHYHCVSIALSRLSDVANIELKI